MVLITHEKNKVKPIDEQIYSYFIALTGSAKDALIV